MAADALLGLATLAQIEENLTQAVSLLTFIIECDGFYYQDKVKAQKQLSALDNTLADEALIAIQEQVKLETVDTMIAAIFGRN